jgi:hypothetical protein
MCNFYPYYLLFGFDFTALQGEKTADSGSFVRYSVGFNHEIVGFNSVLAVTSRILVHIRTFFGKMLLTLASFVCPNYRDCIARWGGSNFIFCVEFDRNPSV